MKLHFSKMHGLGNDFMVIDAISQPINTDQLDIKHLADRRFGVGFDQLLVVEKSEKQDIDFRYRIFNADGNEVEQCGNGARCFARFVHQEGLSDKNPIVVETRSGVISLELIGDTEVRVNMGEPVFAAESIPVVGKLDEVNRISLDVNDSNLSAGVVSMGNPHAVIKVEQFNDADIYQIGFALQTHEAFPAQVNVGFMQIVDRSHINLRVFERGVGETLACGTGACAAVVSGIHQGLLDNTVEVSLTGGKLSIEWPGEGDAVIMQGDATLVYKAEIEIQ